jgi:hypothetical protein
VLKFCFNLWFIKLVRQISFNVAVFLEMAVAFVEMSNGLFGFVLVQPKTDEAHSKWQHFLRQ